MLRADLRVTDTDISRDQGRVRALVLHRLERIWAACEPNLVTVIDPMTQEVLAKPDVRFVEAAVRVTDRLARMYRLDQPAAADPAEGRVPEATRELVSRRLDELEARMSGPGI